jgi:4-hydroxy-tetrahydrodipicolinate synthase
MAALGSLLTAMVTPFDAQQRVDEDATVRLMHHLVEHGSDGLVVCGTTGEASTLTDEEHLGVIELAVQEMGGRCTVVAGVGSNDTRHAVELTERASELGADALLHVAGYYNRPNRRGLIAHYEAVARATELPIVLYNIPSRTTVDMDNELLAELAQIENVVAVKQANHASLAPIDGLDVYAGNDDMLCDVLEMGGAGGICVASHVVGDELRRMVEEPEHRRAIDAALRDLYDALAVTTNPIPIKAALDLLGLPGGGALRLPLVEADERERAVLRGALQRHGLLATAQA